MNPLLSYLKFWWHSKNEHGVHSPFVFNLITKCFYDRSKLRLYQQLSKKNSNSKFLIRLSAYFKYDNCFVSKTIPPELNQALSSEHQAVPFITIEDLINHKPKILKIPCLIYLDINSIEAPSIRNILQICHKDSLIIVPAIRKTKHQFKRWNQLKSQLEISVSIDTFYWGLLFFRTEQPKEHFTIRL